MHRRRTLREKIEARIASKKDDSVFLTREFAGLGGEDQVLRALRGLVRDGKLVRLGYTTQLFTMPDGSRQLWRFAASVSPDCFLVKAKPVPSSDYTARVVAWNDATPTVSF